MDKEDLETETSILQTTCSTSYMYMVIRATCIISSGSDCMVTSSSFNDSKVSGDIVSSIMLHMYTHYNMCSTTSDLTYKLIIKTCSYKVFLSPLVLSWRSNSTSWADDISNVAPNGCYGCVTDYGWRSERFYCLSQMERCEGEAKFQHHCSQR